ncbi:desulfoferrodoxin [Methanocella conradii]|uniref:desulfoferrodoxin n=1 Tax=Methanocella conradii TaxID=1175444 RepID=UPI00157C0180|nr:desulfoferrodoxin [Methanocella conradii]
MAQLYSIYKCSICGNIIEVVHAGGGVNLICCGQPMSLQKENAVDASKEKHVPVVEKTAAGIRVKVGTVPHPMEEKHYIEWIEAIESGRSCKKFLKPGETPEAEFELKGGALTVRAYCNLHGLWKS